MKKKIEKKKKKKKKKKTANKIIIAQNFHKLGPIFVFIRYKRIDKHSEPFRKRISQNQANS